MKLDRRAFIRAGAAGAMGGLLGWAAAEDKPKPGIKIGDRLSPRPTEDEFKYFRQSGVEYASIWTSIEDANYEYMASTKRKLEANGIQILNIGILDLHCDPTIVLGLEGRDKKIEQYQQYLTDLGRAGIRYTTYAHMANIKIRPYYQTSIGRLRGGAPTRLFDLEEARKLPLTHGRVYAEEEIWRTFTDFIRAVMPVAEKAGVRIGLHPDDPPVDSLGGVPRLFRNFDNYRRALDIARSDNFGFCFCIGTWAEGGPMMGKDVIQSIRTLGPQKKIFKVHFRNVDRPLPRFQETFVDEGYLDMYQVMRALRQVRYDGVIIPDHIPGDAPGVNSGYTIGYMRALRDRVNAEFGRG